MRLELTAGQAGDAPMAAQLLDAVAPGATVIADKAYDTNGIHAFVAARGGLSQHPAARHLPERTGVPRALHGPLA